MHWSVTAAAYLLLVLGLTSYGDWPVRCHCLSWGMLSESTGVIRCLVPWVTICLCTTRLVQSRAPPCRTRCLRVVHVAYLSYTLPPNCTRCLRVIHVASELYTLPPSCTRCLLVVHVASELYTLPPSCTCCLRVVHVASELYTLPACRTRCLRVVHVASELYTLPALASCAYLAGIDTTHPFTRSHIQRFTRSSVHPFTRSPVRDIHSLS